MCPSVGAQRSAGGGIRVESIRSGLQDARQVVFLSGVVDLQGHWSHLQTLFEVNKGTSFQELWFPGCLECRSIREQCGTVFCLLAETETSPSSTLSLLPLLPVICLCSEGVLKVEDSECYFRSYSFPIFSASAGERTFVGHQGCLSGVDGAGLECTLPLGAIFDGTDAVHLGPGYPVMSGAILQHLLDGNTGEGVFEGIVKKEGVFAVHERGQEQLGELE